MSIAMLHQDNVAASKIPAYREVNLSSSTGIHLGVSAHNDLGTQFFLVSQAYRSAMHKM